MSDVGASSHVLRSIRSLRGHDDRLSEHLVREVLHIGMLREILLVLVLNDEVKVAEVAERATGEQLHLVAPNDTDTHVFTRVCNDGARQLVWFDLHERLLVQAEVSEELGIFLEVLCGGLSGHAGEVLRLLLRQVGQHALVLEQTALRDEHAHVVEQREVHQLPVDNLKDLTLSADDQVSVVSIVDLVVEGVCAGILDLQVLGRYQEAAQGDEQCVVLFVLRHLGRVQVHQVDGMMNSLIV